MHQCNGDADMEEIAKEAWNATSATARPSKVFRDRGAAADLYIVFLPATAL